MRNQCGRLEISASGGSRSSVTRVRPLLDLGSCAVINAGGSDYGAINRCYQELPINRAPFLPSILPLDYFVFWESALRTFIFLRELSPWMRMALKMTQGF